MLGELARRMKLPREVVALGVVSFLSDISSDMIMPFLPAFVATLSGGGALALGLIEGLADMLSSLLKLVSGAWADRITRYRPFVFAGYTLSLASKPFVALAGSVGDVVLVRCLDRTGKGVRTSPRDAMLAAAVEEGQRGSAFGFHRAMDHAGAVLGPLLALLLLLWFTDDLRTMFWLSAIPGLLAIVFLFVAVKEQPRSAAPAKRWTLRRPDGALLRLIGPLALFTLGNASDLFLLLFASQLLDSLYWMPILWLGLHVMRMLSSLLGGRWTDRHGPVRVIVTGWLWYAGIYALMAFADTPLLVIPLVLLYGVSHGLSEAAEKAWVAGMAPADQAGTWFGWFHLTVGLFTLPASLLFGALWDALGSRTAFLTGAALGLAAVALLLACTPRRRDRLRA